MRWLIAILAMMPQIVAAETLVATRTIRAQAILSTVDLDVIDQTIPGSLTAPEQAIGMEARVVLYAGRPIRPGDVGPAAIIERNQIVTLLYRRASLSIAADGRALGRGGVGDSIRVMNLGSRTTINGLIRADGTVVVGGPEIPAY